jgi:hypothetical protein
MYIWPLVSTTPLDLRVLPIALPCQREPHPEVSAACTKEFRKDALPSHPSSSPPKSYCGALLR